jgi:hypothetical protein
MKALDQLLEFEGPRPIDNVFLHKTYYLPMRHVPQGYCLGPLGEIIRAPVGGGSLDRHGRTDGWVDGDRSLYRRCDSPSPNRYHGHHGIQAIVRDVGPSGGWPTLTKTNYAEWVAVRRV